MNLSILRSVLPLVALWATGPSLAQTTIKDYLFTHNAGPVGANDIIGVAKTVVSDLQTPKDFAVSIGNFGDRDTQNGFGVSFTPGRSSFRGLAVSADEYRKGGLLPRLWGGTTFSYAQNRKKIGAADYDQSALAFSTTFLLKPEEDPIVVAYDALAITEGAGVKCKVQNDALTAADVAFEKEMRRLVDAFEAANGRSPVGAELKAIQRMTDTRVEALRQEEIKALTALRACAHKVASDIEKQWNASRFQLLVGRGWIKGVAGGGRLRLATHAKLSVAWGLAENGLLNLTWRRASDDLDLATLTGAPAYKTTNSAALRYTYKPAKDGKTFAIAEISNVKARSNTASQMDFKRALGVDHMVMPGLWLELRYGRAQKVSGTGTENKALMTLKFSEDTSLDKDTK
jgi:hypothetical protein